MKKILALLLATALTAVLLCVAFLTPMRTAAAPADVRYETFDLLAVDEKAPEADGDAHPWYTDGAVILVNNPSGAEVKLSSGDYRLRYLYILVFDSNGICVEIGNNLFAEDDERAAEFPQHDVPVPAGGFAILYYYNQESPANAALNDFYNDLGGATLYNATMKVSGKKYSAVIENKTVTIYFGADEGTASDGSGSAADSSSAESTATDSVASSAESSADESAASSEVSSEVSSEASSAASSEVTSSAASETSSATSSTADSSAPAASDSSDAPSAASSAASEDGDSNTGLIVGIVIAVVVVIAAVAVIVVVKKKKN